MFLIYYYLKVKNSCFRVRHFDQFVDIHCFQLLSSPSFPTFSSQAFAHFALQNSSVIITTSMPLLNSVINSESFYVRKHLSLFLFLTFETLPSLPRSHYSVFLLPYQSLIFEFPVQAHLQKQNTLMLEYYIQFLVLRPFFLFLFLQFLSLLCDLKQFDDFKQTK